MRKNKIILIFCILIVIVLFFYWVSIRENRLIALHNNQLKQTITSIDENQKTVTLDTIIPFDWDMIYTFPPYTTKEEIEKTIGLYSDAIQETISENMIHLIFINHDTITAYVCGYAEDLGYQIIFDDMILFGDDITFSVTKTNGIIALTAQ